MVVVSVVMAIQLVFILLAFAFISSEGGETNTLGIVVRGLFQHKPRCMLCCSNYVE